MKLFHAAARKLPRTAGCVCEPPVCEGFFLAHGFMHLQGAVTEFVRSLPTKTLTFSGEALEDVPMCTC